MLRITLSAPRNSIHCPNCGTKSPTVNSRSLPDISGVILQNFAGASDAAVTLKGF